MSPGYDDEDDAQLSFDEEQLDDEMDMDGRPAFDRDEAAKDEVGLEEKM